MIYLVWEHSDSTNDLLLDLAMSNLSLPVSSTARRASTLLEEEDEAANMGSAQVALSMFLVHQMGVSKKWGYPKMDGL